MLQSSNLHDCLIYLKARICLIYLFNLIVNFLFSTELRRKGQKKRTAENSDWNTISRFHRFKLGFGRILEHLCSKIADFKSKQTSFVNGHPKFKTIFSKFLEHIFCILFWDKTIQNPFSYIFSQFLLLSFAGRLTDII